jgi:hypothetical protein
MDGTWTIGLSVPVAGQQFFDAGHRMVCDLGQHVAEPGKGINPDEFAGGDETAEHGSRPSPPYIVAEHCSTSNGISAPLRPEYAVIMMATCTSASGNASDPPRNGSLKHEKA